MAREKLPIKTFLERVEKRLSTCSADELRSILRTMASQVAPDDRERFLKSLEPVRGIADAIQSTLRQDDLLSEIDDLIAEIQAEIEEPEERYRGYGYGYDDYDDEDGLGSYEGFIEPLAAFFDRVEGVFDHGNLPLAREAYHRLFGVLDLEDDYGRGIRATDLPNTDMAAARGRYLRAIYETEPPEARPGKLLDEMQELSDFMWRSPVKLADLIQASGRPLPDQESFLRAWISLLREQSGKRADLWLREAIRLAEGTEGLAAFARKEGKDHPRAYLDWLEALLADRKHADALAAGREALRKLPADLSIRADVADRLCQAAQGMDDDKTFRKGRWEAFAAQPTLSRLLDLWIATPPAQRPQRMRQAARHLEELRGRGTRRSSVSPDRDEDLGVQSFAWDSPSVLAHAHMLGREWSAARSLAAKKAVLGWSSSENPQGAVVPVSLGILSGALPDLPPNLAQLWKWTLGSSPSYAYSEDESLDPERLEAAYQEVAKNPRLDDSEADALLHWCVDVGKRRAIAIVEGLHRKSYDKAAVLAAACAETLRARGQGDRGDALLKDLRERFPRHRSFQDELKAAVAGSTRLSRGYR
jgi:hypothetical protein